MDRITLTVRTAGAPIVAGHDPGDHGHLIIAGLLDPCPACRDPRTGDPTGAEQDPRWAALHADYADLNAELPYAGPDNGWKRRRAELEAIADDLNTRGIPEDRPCSVCRGTRSIPGPDAGPFLELIRWALVTSPARRATVPPPPVLTR